MPLSNVLVERNTSLDSQKQQQQLNLNDDDDGQAMSNTNQSSSDSGPSSPRSSCNSSFGSNSGKYLNNTSNTSITALVPGGVVTTQNISTVIKPKSNNNSLQFVKIQTPELSKKAVEQIKLAEETKISKSKIKEGEEEWQNHLLNWKSKRRQHTNHITDHDSSNPFETSDTNVGRKVKTFAEMIEQRARSGNRLGFHLQRYMDGNDDDDNEDQTNLTSEQNESIMDENASSQGEQISNVNQVKNNTEFDYEIHSSTSSDYNLAYNNKSPSSPDILVDPPKNNIAKSSPKLSAHNCDYDTTNNNNNIIQGNYDEKDLSSSFEVGPELTKPLNSTFKHDINSKLSSQISPSIPDNINEETTIGSVIATRDDDAPTMRSEEEESDNSGFEEEEEEEQKQLQRIAFEAKLKAFERLTVPSAQAPPPLPPPLKPKPSRLINKATMNEANSLQMKSPRLECGIINHDDRPKINASKLPKDKPSLSDSLNSIRSDIEEDILQASMNNLGISSKRPAIPPPLQSATNHFTTKQSQNYMPQHVDQNPLTTPPSSMRLPVVLPLGHDLNPQMISKDQSPTLMASPENGNFKQTEQIPQKPKNISPVMKQQKPLLDSIQMNPLPPPPPQTMLQRKSSRNDGNDRTVLSVSGKKRCSSCKEELGRGAAAFVVESLSLVYHTNCFRCSVCHVNLANGFRGVDVRVHAGALHCQNCYSRDGLNFSRV